MKRILISSLVLVVLVLAACGDSDGDSPAVEGSPAEASPAGSVKFKSPEDGDKVANPVKVQMEATGVKIEPASSGVNENAGHFHIMIDTECVTVGEVIPNDDIHKHYGMAQTEAELTLPAGEHELCLQLADGAHVALPLTDTIEVTVE